MIGTGPASRILDVDPRTVERAVDAGILRGGRPSDPVTGLPIPRSHRWVDARHAVAMAVASGRAHLIPREWRHLIDRTGRKPRKRPRQSVTPS